MKNLIPVMIGCMLLLSACDSGVAVDPDTTLRTETTLSLEVAPAAPLAGGVLENRGRGPREIGASVQGSASINLYGESYSYTVRAVNHNHIVTDPYIGNPAEGRIQVRSDEGLSQGNVECLIVRTDQAEIFGHMDDGEPFFLYVIDDDIFDNLGFDLSSKVFIGEDDLDSVLVDGGELCDGHNQTTPEEPGNPTVDDWGNAPGDPGFNPFNLRRVVSGNIVAVDNFDEI